MKIKVIGSAGSGKSTIAYAIKEFLTEKGFNNVNYCDDEYNDNNDYFTPEKQNKRLKAISLSQISIETVQVNRNGIE